MKKQFTFQSIGYFLLNVLIFLSPLSVIAEGTKQIRPQSTDNGFLILDNQWSKFALYGCPSTSRLHIRICNAGEKIYYGFRQTDNDVEYRIKDQSGATVVGPALLPSAGSGRIGTHAQAVAGPKQIVGAAGYDALVYTTTTAGDYYIEFKDNGSRRTFDLFDITVATSADVALPGRIWSQAWMFSTNNFNNEFKGKLFIYSDDRIVTSLDFNGMQPYVFVVSANATGTQSTGNGALDRQSRTGLSTYPQYKIFMNDPDISCFPTGSLGDVIGDPTISGCGQNRLINITVDTPGNILVLLDLNGVAGYQPGTADRQFAKTVVAGLNTIPWDTKDGLGNLVTPGTILNLQIDYLNGITHLPLYDVEKHPNGYIVTLVRPSSATTPQLFWDDVKVPGGSTQLTGCSSPCHTWTWDGTDGNDYGNQNTINTWWYGKIITKKLPFPISLILVDANRNNPPGAANDTTVCVNTGPIKLAGLVSGSTTTGQWSTLTGGTFSNITDLNGTYTLTSTEKTNGLAKVVLTSTNNGSCPGATDTLLIHVVPGPTAAAGPDQSLCKNNATATLAGSKTLATGITWSGGSGTFIPDNTTSNATYKPAAAELTAGSITLTLTTTGNGICPAATDQVKITYTAAPSANAGKDTTRCSNNAALKLYGTVSNATSFTWVGGAGTFSPDRNTLAATYTPAAGELTAKSVTLTLKASKAGCTDVTDDIKISFAPTPVVNAGTDASACSNNPKITLGGSVTGATGGNWTGGLGTFTPDRQTLNAIYEPTTAEKASGVTLTLTATGSGCLAVTDQVKLSYTAAPIVNGGSYLPLCSNKTQITLNGSVSGATGGKWINGAGTFVPDANTLNAQYTPTPAEISSGALALALESTGNGNCSFERDTVVISFTPAPTVNAGTDRTVCANNPTLTLAASATGGGTLTWTGQTGTISSVNNPTATYTLSPAEIAAKTVTLTFTASKATCNNVQDQMVITVTDAPVINAGADQTLCANNAAATLNASLTGTAAISWTGGAGTFTPSRNVLNPVYTPSAGEISAGNITLTLNTLSDGSCNAVSDAVTLNFTGAPTADAGTDQTRCANNATVSLIGTPTVATQGSWTGGAGTFTPSAAGNNIQYIPTPAEIAGGSITLTYTTTDNGNCNSASDNIKISFTPAPAVSAGSDRTVCEDNPSVTLSGNITVASGGTWTGGAGSFSPSNTALGATYTPTDAEKQAGSVTLTLTSAVSNSCNAVSDNLTITITKAPAVNAGSNQTVCGSVSTVTLKGTVTVATGGTWTTSGTGSFSVNQPAGKYKPSAADVSAGSVTLTLKSTGNGTCQEASDFMVVKFTKVPTIYAGPDQTVCTNEFPVLLNATGSPAEWSGGTGTFSNTADLNATYTPGTADTTAGSVTLTVTTIPSGACAVKSDKVKITFTRQPVPDAGADQTICGKSTAVTLGGTMKHSAGGFWTTTGQGSFNPNAGTVSAQYIPSPAERASGAVITNILTSTPNSPCPSEEDTMQLTIAPEVIVEAGPDQTLCADVTTLQLNGLIQNAPGGTWSVVSGTGIIANTSALSTTYTVTAADTTAKTVTLRLTSQPTASCSPVTDDIVITFTPAPKANAGTDATICADAPAFSLSGTVANAAGGKWTSSGTGTFSPSASVLNPAYIPSPADTAAHSVILTLETTGIGTCNTVQDQMTLTIIKKPVVNAGTDLSVCADASAINISGTAANATALSWTTSGTGIFSNAAILNTVYTPSAADKNGATVTLTLTATAGTCIPVQDKKIITFTPAPTVNAGPDLTICSDASGADLHGKVTIATGGQWTSSGSGTFVPDNTTLNAVYKPSPADTTAGMVTLTLSTTGGGSCNTYQDALILTITHKPVITAGGSSTICADSAYVALNGTKANAAGAEWSSSGTGTFFPNNTTLNANYVPSAADRASGLVTLTLTSTGHGSCNAVQASRTITITPGPVAGAGADQNICASAGSINISGTVSIASGGIWTTSGNGTFASAASLATTYTPSANDIAAGTVVLTLTTTGNGNCKSTSDQLTLTINPVPVVNAGPDKTICADVASITLNGNVLNATGGGWTTTGTGAFSDTSALNAVYFLSQADKTAGSVKLKLRSTGNGTCAAQTDDLLLLITPAPTVNAGADQTICANSSATITAQPTVATQGTWTSSGSGSFTPNASAVTATYFPSAADRTAGSVTLTFTTTNNGTCNAVDDNLVLTLSPVPAANAGTDVNACADIEFIQLSGAVSNATGVKWTTDGTGSFVPDAATVNALYYPSAGDKNNGVVTLTLATEAGLCQSVSDQMKISFSPIPKVTAGPDIAACTGIPSVSLNPSVSIATGGTWTTQGSGSFSPDENTLNADYIPSAVDQAAGTVILVLTSTGNGACIAINDSVKVSFSPVPSISAGPAQTVCETDLPVQLAGSGTTGVWSGGAGTFSPNANTLNATYLPTAAEITAGSVMLTLTTTGIGSCTPGVSNVTITIKAGGPAVNAGTDIQACTNATSIPLAATFSGAGGVQWSTASGTGTFSSNTDAGATFTPSPSQIQAGVAHLTATTTGNNGCSAQSDKVDIILTPAPAADAGFDQKVCASAGTVQLSGSKTVATGVTWSKVTGAGTFDNAASLSPIYTIDPSDIALGSVTLKMTTTGNGTNCNPVSDEVIISFTSTPAANAGAASGHCADVASIALNGTSTTNAGQWSTSGSGVFSPSPDALNADYIPSAADKTGNVTLTLTTTGNGVCAAGTASRTLTFTAPPVVSAGSDRKFCADVTSATLGGSFSHAGGIQWTTTGTGSFSSATDPAAIYTPSAQDIANGGANLTIRTTGNAPCAEAEDHVAVIILPAPSSLVNAGFDQSVCRDVASVSLEGQILVAGGGKWTTSGSGSFVPSDSSLKAEYIPSAADKNAGSVKVTLFSTANGICNPASDDMTITFTPGTTAAIALIPAVCEDINTVALAGSFTVASGIQWTTSGTGSFAPNEFTAGATYIPSAEDRQNGSIGVTIITVGNGTCLPAMASRTISFTRKPVLNAGLNKTVCSDIAAVTLNASVSGSSGITWTGSGTGTFNPANAATVLYTPSAADLAATRVNVKITANGTGTCGSVTDTLTIDFTPAPTVEAGPAQTICADQHTVALSPQITVATGGRWSTSGSGLFSPGSTLLNAAYIPSEADKSSGSVTLTLTTTGNGNCKAVSDTRTITITPKPAVSAGPAVICAFLKGAALNGSKTNAGGVIWTSSGTGTFSPSAAVLNPTYFPSQEDAAAGSVTLTVTTTGNQTCNPVSATTKILVAPLPVADAGNDQFVCTGSSVTLAARTAPNVTYAWTDKNGSGIGSAETVSFPVPANTFVVLAVTDQRGCSSRDTIRLNTFTLPALTLPAHACLTDSLVLDAQPNNMPVVPGTFQWYNNNVLIPGENDFTLVVKKTGTTTIRWSYGSQQCDVSKSTDVTAPPVLRVQDSVIACIGENANLSVLVTPAAAMDYQWSQGGAVISTSPVLTPATTATPVTYLVKVTDAMGCNNTDSINLRGILKPDFDITDSTGCENVAIIFDATPSNIPGFQTLSPVFEWKNGSTILAETGSTLAASSAGKYTVTLTIDQCLRRDTANVIINPKPLDGMTGDTYYCDEEKGSLLLDAGAGPGYTYLWKNEKGDTLGFTQTQTAENPGKYFVRIQNQEKCYLTDSILVRDVCKPRIIVKPTAFSPNGKGPEVNEKWGLYLKYATNFKLTIFNRWGEIIFYTENPEEGWDGTYRGEPMPIGVYPYLVTYDGMEKEYKGPYKEEGSVTIVR